MAKALLDRSGVEYDTIAAEENLAFVKENQIYQVPALLVTQEGTTQTFTGLSEIQRYVRTYHA